MSKAAAKAKRGFFANQKKMAKAWCKKPYKGDANARERAEFNEQCRQISMMYLPNC